MLQVNITTLLREDYPLMDKLYVRQVMKELWNRLEALHMDKCKPALVRLADEIVLKWERDKDGKS